MISAPLGYIWYVMLFPSPAEDREIGVHLRALAGRTGGEPTAAPHVTIGYFSGQVSGERVIECLRPLRGPNVPIVADDLHSWSDEAHNLYGYTLSLKVPDTPELLHWQRAAHEAIRPLPLIPIFPVDDHRRHLQVIQHLPVPPSEVLRHLGDHHFTLQFTATRLVVSCRLNDQFTNVFERALAAEAD